MLIIVQSEFSPLTLKATLEDTKFFASMDSLSLFSYYDMYIKMTIIGHGLSKGVLSIAL